MLRTSLRTDIEHLYQTAQSFLSSNAQDFIEESEPRALSTVSSDS